MRRRRDEQERGWWERVYFEQIRLELVIQQNVESQQLEAHVFAGATTNHHHHIPHSSDHACPFDPSGPSPRLCLCRPTVVLREFGRISVAQHRPKRNECFGHHSLQPRPEVGGAERVRVRGGQLIQHRLKRPANGTHQRKAEHTHTHAHTHSGQTPPLLAVLRPKGKQQMRRERRAVWSQTHLLCWGPAL
jgi:hypothetical protein